MKEDRTIFTHDASAIC